MRQLDQRYTTQVCYHLLSKHYPGHLLSSQSIWDHQVQKVSWEQIWGHQLVNSWIILYPDESIGRKVCLLYFKPTCLSNRTVWVFSAFSTETHCSCCVAISRAYRDDPMPIWLVLWSWEIAIQVQSFRAPFPCSIKDISDKIIIQLNRKVALKENPGYFI